MDPSGNLIVSLGSSLRKYTSAGTLVGGWSVGGFNQAYGIAVASNGTIYVTDTSGKKVYKVKPDGSGKSVHSNDAKLTYPAGIALDASENMFIANPSGDFIYKIATGSAVAQEIAFNQGDPWGACVVGTTLYVSQWGRLSKFNTATGAEESTPLWDWETPNAVFADPTGNLWVGGSWDLYRVRPGGRSIDFFTIGDGQEGPRGIARDGAGFIYVADRGGSIAKYDPTRAQAPSWLHLGDEGEFAGLCLDSSGTALLLSYKDSHQVKRVALSDAKFSPTPFWPYNPIF
ncbi:Serine/threonine-protein kinase PknD [compost metagenome]